MTHIKYLWRQLMKDKPTKINLADIVNQYPAPILHVCAHPVQPLTGTTTLTTPTEQSDPLWDSSIKDFCTDLTQAATMLQFNCLGLAANQIWKSEEACPAIFVMRWPIDNFTSWKWQEIINPEIVTSGKKTKHDEGCLSLLGHKLEKKTQRRANVTLTYQTQDSIIPQTIKFYGHLGPYAQIVQHEYDHLQGKLCGK